MVMKGFIMSKRLTIEEFIKTLSKGGSESVGSGILVVECQRIVNDEGSARTLDHTWQEIHDAGLCVVHEALVSKVGIVTGDYYELITDITSNGAPGEQYIVSTSSTNFTINSPDGYPTIQEEEAH